MDAATIRHSGYLVKDLNQEIAYFRNRLGLRVCYFAREHWPNQKPIDVVKMADPEGQLIELIGGAEWVAGTHTAFSVKDTDIWENPLMLKEDDSLMVTYTQSPGGIFLEFVREK